MFTPHGTVSGSGIPEAASLQVFPGDYQWRGSERAIAGGGRGGGPSRCPAPLKVSASGRPSTGD